MKKKILIIMALVIFISLIGVSTVSSQNMRFGIGLDVPFYFGIQFSALTGDEGTTEDEGFSVGAFIPFPNLSLHYIFDTGLINVGIGARMWTLILESIIYPSALVQVNLGDFVISSEIGGFGFLFLGLFTTGTIQPVMTTDFNLGYRFTDWFRLGGGLQGILTFGTEENASYNMFSYMIYIDAEFTWYF